MIDVYKRWLDAYNSKSVGAQDLCAIQKHLKMMEEQYAKAKKPRITFGEFVNAVNKEVGLEPKHYNIIIFNYLGNYYAPSHLKSKEKALVQYSIDYGNFDVRLTLEQSLNNVDVRFDNCGEYSFDRYAVVKGKSVDHFPMQMPLRQIVESGTAGKIYEQLMQSKIESKRAITKNS